MNSEKITGRQSLSLGGDFADLIFSMGVLKTEANDAQSDKHILWKNVRLAVEDSFTSQAAFRLNRRANLDPRVIVDRSKPIDFQRCDGQFLFPDIQENGPEEPDMNEVVQWQHPAQKIGVRRCQGQDILDHLKSTGDIRYCFGVRELGAIAERGAEFFSYYFKGRNNFFAWKSLKLTESNFIVVPYMYVDGGAIHRSTRIISDTHGWTESDFALLAPKPF